MNMENVMNSLTLMGKGMLAIFVVVIIIFIVVSLLIRFTSDSPESSDEE